MDNLQDAWMFGCFVHLVTKSLPLSSLRLNLTRTKLLTKAARGFMCRTPAKSSDSSSDGENDNKDYVPLASLQLASGAFVLDVALCEAINVPMDKLKWTSPFTRHRVSLSQLSHSSNQEELTVSRHNASLKSPSPGTDPQFPNEPSTALLGDGSRASEPEASGTPGKPEPEGMVWATAVALAWLEHSSASYFIEWELAAAKASMWLDAQSVPEGRDLAAVKAAANQLFIILRHWDENLQLNMLCYNPNSV
uniref:Uncharacterized protein n=1 Tax=Denticeps clupeoides TaxID=299321 RepID=A0A8C4C6G3_9TELE